MRKTADGANAHVAISTDDGRSFSAEQAAISNDAVCPCCQLTVAFGGDALFLGYRKLYADGRDSTVARSTDAGRTSRVKRLPLGGKIDGCPLKPTELAGRSRARRVYRWCGTCGVYFRGRRTAAGPSAAGCPPGALLDARNDRGPGRPAAHRLAGQSRRAFRSPPIFIAESRDGAWPVGAGGSQRPQLGHRPAPWRQDSTVYVTWEREGEGFVTHPSPGRSADRRDRASYVITAPEPGAVDQGKPEQGSDPACAPPRSCSPHCWCGSPATDALAPPGRSLPGPPVRTAAP
jgi:hypothetical protein